MSFDELNLHPEILRAVKEAGYLAPTPIQEKAIPKIIEKCDLFASAQTGTGKTAAFMLPSLQRLMTPATVRARGPRILVLVPTRELALQVAAESAKYSKYMERTKTVCIYGGAPYPIQNRDLSRPYEILVATPGRLIDHLQRGRIDFGRLELLILDEADRMLDMGFIDAVDEIANATPKTRQTLLFSATFKGAVIGLSRRLLNNPIEIKIAAVETKHENIDQRLHYVDNIDHKNRLLNHLLSDEELNQAIVFTSTKSQADQLCEQLLDNGHSAAALHGDMHQRQRMRTIANLRDGKVRILVATDVAARGIDIQSISHVINFDLPGSEEDYVHRIGRTGRAGAKGIAWSFASPRDRHVLGRIEKYTGQKIASHVVPGMEPQIKVDEFSGNAYNKRNTRRPTKYQPRQSQNYRGEYAPRSQGSFSTKSRGGYGSRPQEGNGQHEGFSQRSHGKPRYAPAGRPKKFGGERHYN